MAVILKQRPRVKVSDVRVGVLRAFVASDAGSDWVSSSRAAELVRSAQAVPSVTRQVLVLWAQRYGTQGESWRYGELSRSWHKVQPVEISLEWLARFLERTGRAVVSDE